MPTREETSKPYTRDDVDRIGWDMRPDGPRLYATVDALARAAAEADSLRARLDAQTQHGIALARMIEALARGEHPPKSEHAPYLGLVAERAQARLDKLQAFKDYVHQRLDAAGVPADPEADKNAEHGCRIEGRLNFVEATADSLRAQLEEARKDLAAGVRGLKDLASMVGPREAGWSDLWSSVELLKRERDATQGEVAGLRSALEFYADPGTYHACAFLFDRPTGGFDEDFDEGHAGYNRPMPGKTARAALTSTRATADAHDERVRREAMEEVRAESRRLLDSNGSLLVVRVVESLAKVRT